MDGGSGSSYGGGGGGMGATTRILSRASRGTASLESGGQGYTLEYLRGMQACVLWGGVHIFLVLCFLGMDVGLGEGGGEGFKDRQTVVLYIIA